MIPWKAITAAVVIFGAGVLSGAMGVQLYRAKTELRPPQRVPGGPPGPWVGPRMDFMRRIGDRLGLSDEQKQQIDQHLRESQQRMRELWDPLAPKFKEEMERVRRAIDAELTPEQRQKAELIQSERHQGPPGDRPPGRWGDGQGPRSRRGQEPGAPPGGLPAPPPGVLPPDSGPAEPPR